MVVLWLAVSPYSRKLLGLTPDRGLYVWSLHALPVSEWVSSRYSSFLPPSKDTCDWLADYSKLVVGMNVCLSMNGDLFYFILLYYIIFFLLTFYDILLYFT